MSDKPRDRANRLIDHFVGQTVENRVEGGVLQAAVMVSLSILAVAEAITESTDELHTLRDIIDSKGRDG